MENKNNNKGFLKGALVGALAMFIVLGGLGWLFLCHGVGGTANKGVLNSKTETKIDKMRELIDGYYLYDVSDEELQNGIYEGYISGLDDPYSVYYDEAATKDLLESTTGEYSGIGAVMTQDADNGLVKILQVYKDCPGEKAGLKEGDIIYQVDDHELTGEEDLSEVVSWIKGEQGTDVKLHVYRGDEAEEMELTATRDVVKAQTVSHEMKENQIGYIRVSEFDTVTYDQFAEALTDLENQNMQGLVIDLRSNPGGNVSTVCDMLRLLLPKGLIVYTEDKDGKRQEYSCDGASEFTKPLTVLVDGYSASASEIFSGAVQDYGIGKIVGTTTYGKGVVQQLMDLKDGTYLKLTIAEYFTPKGRSINKKGIEPDVEVEYKADENNAEADNQLDKALEVIQEELK
ncbi:S41 family peptidase [Hespellia stercorisuis]|uniref:Carboxyl-terminal processing protease n=1 Tax=Hespellia stercorisuis DSM 15480 TaxID=1121950 RepID=A0A1M6T1K4_9FIRM|nr:S41 family peptidase [Hespellia stercorisuis]SHK50797.1 carboxyl-terminal processing protease [Hespellia stercorisuis DSM 15480]